MSHANTPPTADHEADLGIGHVTLRGYLTGFVLAVVTTMAAFGVVMGHVFTHPMVTIGVVLGLAAAQILVHVIYFLHLDARSEGGWNLLAFLFTVVLVVIVLGASIWVMYHENARMMPAPTAMSTMDGAP